MMALKLKEIIFINSNTASFHMEKHISFNSDNYELMGDQSLHVKFQLAATDFE